MTVKLNIVPRFPGRVIDGAGIDVEQQNGNWIVSVNYADFPLVSPFTPGPNHYVLVWDAAADSYFLVPATSL